MIDLVLASRSAQRLSLLKQVGYIPNKIIDPDCDEVPQKGELPRQLVERLAREKFISAHNNLDSGGKDQAKELVIVSADTVVAKGRRVIAPPNNPEEAAFNYQRLCGGTHRVITSVVVGNNTEKFSQRTVITKISVKRLHDSEIDFLVSTNEWQGRAGGYAIQGSFALAVKSINGSYTSVVGLPIYETANLLRGFGVMPTLQLL